MGHVARQFDGGSADRAPATTDIAPHGPRVFPKRQFGIFVIGMPLDMTRNQAFPLWPSRGLDRRAASPSVRQPRRSEPRGWTMDRAKRHLMSGMIDDREPWVNRVSDLTADRAERDSMMTGRRGTVAVPPASERQPGGQTTLTPLFRTPRPHCRPHPDARVGPRMPRWPPVPHSR